MTTGEIKRYVRFTHGDRTAYGVLDGDLIAELEGDLFDDPRPTGRAFSMDEVFLEVPVDPLRVQKVLGIARNYNDPETAPRVMPHPRWFAKLPSALNRHGGEVELPPDSTNLNFEGELVLIIGKRARYLTPEEAPSIVFGVTAGNDWSENTWYQEGLGPDEPSRLISKSMDSWACLYHTIVTGLDYSDLGIEVRLNGAVAARGRTRHMTNSVGRLLSYISQFITLMPGDVIYTGTVNPPCLPGVRRQMRDGDVVEVDIEGIGTLSNQVVPQRVPRVLRDAA